MENDWVEINLPWYVSNPTNDKIKSLEDEATKYFDKFKEEFKNKHNTSYDKFMYDNNDIVEWMKNSKTYKKSSKLYGLINKEQEGKHGFDDHPLKKAGTLIEVLIGEEKKQFLIGHINESCGVCDDCTEFSRHTIVLRAKVVWEP